MNNAAGRDKVWLSLLTWTREASSPRMLWKHLEIAVGFFPPLSNHCKLSRLEQEVIWYEHPDAAAGSFALKLRTYHGKIRISKYGRFLPFLVQWLYFPLEAHNFWHRQPIWLNSFDIRSGEWLSNLIVIINAEKHQTRKKCQKRPKIAKNGRNPVSLLQWLYWPVKDHNFFNALHALFDPFSA
jgi:hypothetical protein